MTNNVSKHAVGDFVLYWDEKRCALDKVKIVQIKFSSNGVHYDITGGFWGGRYKDWISERVLFKSKEEALGYVDKRIVT